MGNLIDVKNFILDNGYENVTIFENPDYASAFIGVSEDERAIYDYEKMIQSLIETDNMDEDEAIEFIEYNTIRALPYMPNSPVILYTKI